MQTQREVSTEWTIAGLVYLAFFTGTKDLDTYLDLHWVWKQTFLEPSLYLSSPYRNIHCTRFNHRILISYLFLDVETQIQTNTS